MAEVRKSVKTYSISYQCDNCGSDKVEREPVVLTSNPPKFRYKCLDCSETFILDKSYPYLHYEYEDEMQT